MVTIHSLLDHYSLAIRCQSPLTTLPLFTHYSLTIRRKTSQLTPRLINDFKHLLLDDEHIETTSKIFDTFQADLIELSAQIDKRNEKRRYLWQVLGVFFELVL